MSPIRQLLLPALLIAILPAILIATLHPSVAYNSNSKVNTSPEREINVYSYRQPFLLKPLIEAYQDASGVKVNTVFADKGLVQRLQAEGNHSRADVILTTDIAQLIALDQANLLAPIQSPKLDANIPQHLRDPDQQWFGLSIRARIIILKRNDQTLNPIQRYEDLADPQWKGRICSRTGSHPYNRALLASIIASHGPEFAEKWAEGLVNNMARRPQGNDRAQAKAIYEGLCDISIINSYYFNKMLNSNKPEQQQWAQSVRVLFPNQNDRGAHINIAGAGLSIYAPNKILAIQFIEFLASNKAQQLYANINNEYPVNPNLPSLNPDFRADQIPIEQIADLSAQAQRIINRVGW